MTKKELEKEIELKTRRQVVLKEAWRIFADAVNYSEDELIVYTNLVNRMFNIVVNDRNILISKLNETIYTLAPREFKILSLRNGLNGYNVITLKEIGKVFQISSERVRQLEARALRKLRNRSNIYCIDKIASYHEKKMQQEIENLKKELMHHNIKPLSNHIDCCGEEDIDSLDFSVRIYNALKRGGVSTIKDFLCFPEEKFIKIKNLGSKSVEIILEKKQEFVKKFSNTKN